MSYEQIARDCDGEVCGISPCTAIEGVRDGEVISRTHLHADAHIEHRINLDYPEVIDHRSGAKGKVLAWTLWCDACLPYWTQTVAAGTDMEALRETVRCEAESRGLL